MVAASVVAAGRYSGKNYGKFYISSKGCNMAGGYYMANGSDSSYGTSGSDHNDDVYNYTPSSYCYNYGYKYCYTTLCVHDTPPGDSLYMENCSSGYS